MSGLGVFRATRALRMVVKKTSTGIVGLEVDVNARSNLIALQEKILEKVKIIPPTVQYRKDVESISNYRLKVAREMDDEEKIEEEINMGQLEELIQQGESEMRLIDIYAEHRLWETVEELQQIQERKTEA
ncbi:unnamed protein product [Discosporangium mesarthrocarpum]